MSSCKQSTMDRLDSAFGVHTHSWDQGDVRENGGGDDVYPRLKALRQTKFHSSEKNDGDPGEGTEHGDL